MNILSLLTNHKHYWGIPHERPHDKRIIQICYECGAEREPKVDLHPSFAQENECAKTQDVKAA
jgi:hypothetical protein